MRGWAALALAGMLAGCKENQSFDERYDETANQIEQRAENLDAEASGPNANSAAETGRSNAP